MLKDLTRDAYLAVGGSGYGRVDIRTNIRDFNDPNFKAFVLEVNAQPGFSFNVMTTSMGAILTLEKVPPTEFINTIL
jgi:D-alanine-D-alanine ligase-like ATP-grasp enzyme